MGGKPGLGEKLLFFFRVKTVHKPGQGCTAPTPAPRTVTIVAEGAGLTLTQGLAARRRGRSGSTSFPGLVCVAGQLQCAGRQHWNSLCLHLAAQRFPSQEEGGPARASVSAQPGSLLFGGSFTEPSSPFLGVDSKQEEGSDWDRASEQAPK